MQLLLGFILAIIVSVLAYRARSLDKSGALAATVVGTIVFGVGGWQWAVLLLGFFITSSAEQRFKTQTGPRCKFSGTTRRRSGLATAGWRRLSC
jgi:uncharacterized membrane protein